MVHHYDNSITAGGIFGQCKINPEIYYKQHSYNHTLAHLPWTTMGLFPVLLCITNTCSMMSMMARGEVHRPSGVQHDIWNWVTLCTWPDCKTGGEHR